MTTLIPLRLGALLLAAIGVGVGISVGVGIGVGVGSGVGVAVGAAVVAYVVVSGVVTLSVWTAGSGMPRFEANSTNAAFFERKKT